MRLIKEIKWKLRQLKYAYQKLRYGVSDMDCWSLDDAMSRDILKKLKYYRKFQEVKGVGYPAFLNSKEQWLREIDYMIAFWAIEADQWNRDYDKLTKTYVFRRGYVAFNKYFHNLWD